MKLDRSQSVFEAAQRRIPGGVNSPVRAYRTVGGTPVHIAEGKGALVRDIDGNEFIDLVCSYGPLILGHAPDEVNEAVAAALAKGTTFGAPTEGELSIAEEICGRVACAEKVRLVNSGTEATMSALRLARAATGRDAFVKFNGCYHGHADSFLVKAGSGALTHGDPDSPGVPAALAAMTLVPDYNELAEVEKLFAERGKEIAAVFVEPVAGNMGTVLPAEGFLEGLRALCDESGALLIYDEVMTGFRVARGGYAELTPKAQPDLVTLGKVIGGGLPIGAYAGRADLMAHISPEGSVYQAGTLSGNPIAVAAGLATLQRLTPEVYGTLESAGARLQAGLERIAADHDVPLSVGRQGSMLCPYFSAVPVHRFDDVVASDRVAWNRFFHAMLEEGVLLPPSPFEAWFLSTAHDSTVIDRVLQAAERAFQKAATTTG
ncbi:MAG: glutamate-1-semialdehyde 2,1-aminomutase [Planctomycetota bacterium]